jgi:hypothetical protein
MATKITDTTFRVRPTFLLCAGAWYAAELMSITPTSSGEKIVLKLTDGPSKGKRVTTGDASLIARDKDGKRRYRSGEEIVR